jgi:hypothetical protein
MEWYWKLSIGIVIVLFLAAMVVIYMFGWSSVKGYMGLYLAVLTASQQATEQKAQQDAVLAAKQLAQQQNIVVPVIPALPSAMILKLENDATLEYSQGQPYALKYSINLKGSDGLLLRQVAFVDPVKPPAQLSLESQHIIAWKDAYTMSDMPKTGCMYFAKKTDDSGYTMINIYSVTDDGTTFSLKETLISTTPYSTYF